MKNGYSIRKTSFSAALRRLAVIGVAALGPASALAADITLGTFSRNGSAVLLGNGDLRLTTAYDSDDTPETLGQAGSAFGAFVFDGNPVQFDFSFRISPIGDASRGDGLAFVLHKSGPGALGGDGSGLGYAGIGDSLAIEFDTFGFDDESPVPHVAVHTYGNAGDGDSLAEAQPPSGVDPDWFADGDVWSAQLSFDREGDNDILRVRVGESLYDDLIELNLGTTLAAFLDIAEGETFYAGFTAATGAAGSFHDITLMGADGVTPVPLPAAAWLLLSGLAGVGAFARRRRVERAAPGASA